MKRREFIKAVAAAGAVVCSSDLLARDGNQQFAGILAGTNLSGQELDAVRYGLKEQRFSEQSNLKIEYESAAGHYEKLPDLAKGLLEHHVAVIMAIGGTVTAFAAKSATQTVPIIFATAGDPVKLKLMPSLNRPGGNITGVTFQGVGLTAKRLQLLHELVPSAKRVGFLVNPRNPNWQEEASSLASAAGELAIVIDTQQASSEQEIDVAFSKFAFSKVEALIIAADAIYTRAREKLVSLSNTHSLPAIYALPQFVSGGGLVSYGASRLDAFRLVGVYAGRILNGEHPGDLPVQQSEKIEWVINAKTANSLGLTIPVALLGRADKVIE